MNGENYKAWEIDEKDFPNNGSLEEKIQFLVGYGILAPSTHNTQPWLCSVKDNELVVSINPALKLPAADPDGRGELISLGCLVTNINVAAEYFGLEAGVVELDEKNETIRLEFGISKHQALENKQFQAITRRYSDKRDYLQTPVKVDHKSRLLKLKGSGGTNLILVDDKTKVLELAGLQRDATLGYAGNRQFFNELSKWLKPSNTKLEEGMPGFVVGLSNLKSKTFPLLIKNLKPLAKLLAKRDYELASTGPMLGVISSSSDDRAAWFNAGKYFEEIALEATACGLVITPLAAIIENKQQRKRLAYSFDLNNPQIFFRIGYSKHKPYHTPRRNNLNGTSMETLEKLTKVIGIPITTRQVRIEPYTLNYIVAGEGKPILLLHGANIGWAQWYQNIAELAKHYKVYALDLPGAGDSTKVNFYKTDFESDYVRIVDKFIETQNFKKISIVGSSFGGWIALKLAIEHRPYIDKIVIGNPLGFTAYMPSKFRPVSFRPLAKFLSKTVLRPSRNNKNLEKFMRDVFFDKSQPLAVEFVDYFYELSKTSHNLLFISRLAHFKGMRKELFLKKSLPYINNPVMVIWGKEDPLMPYDTVLDNIKLIPNVRLITLDEVGHMPPVEAADKFNKLTIDFLK